MSLFKILDVAASGLAAQNVRLNLTASNLANADAVSSSVGETYRARHPVFAAVYEAAALEADGAPGASGVGVGVTGGVESPAPSFDRRASCSGKVDDAFLGGPGSEFWFEVRLEKTATALPAPTELDAAPATSGPGTLAASHARILLAEDSLTNRKVALAMLGRLGVAADVASNGLEALEALETTRYDLILMDMQMPGMDGVEATERIRGEDSPSAYRRIPIIAMTACAMEGDRETCLAAGMDDYLSKPVTVAALRGMLEKWLPKDGASGSS